jgi:hypothetical protein
MQISQMFKKDINRPINGVIKIGSEGDFNLERTINELEEYVVTREIAVNLTEFFKNFKPTAKGAKTEEIGVWISGFFGSGKSHFLKILSYLLSGKKYDGKYAYEYFNGKVSDDVLSGMKSVSEMSSEIVLFNIDQKSDADSKANKDAIVTVFMKVFNEMQGFCGNIPWVAEIERSMTRSGTFEAFRDKYREVAGIDWEDGRNDIFFESDNVIAALTATQNMSEESARKWCESAEENYSLDISQFAEKVRKYNEWQTERTGRQHHVIFLCDELGQYMGTDGNLLLNLQTVVETLGTECAGTAWVIATGQEDISSIVKETKGGRDAFSKIIGRFKTRLPLTSANADEVIKKRLLDKTDTAAELLKLTYAEKLTALKNAITFSNGTPEKKTYRGEDDFVDVYPFIPYHFGLLQEVFNGIRKHGASGKHLSEGERSLLNAFQDAAKQFKSFEIGMLIPFDAFYKTVETFLDHNIRKVISGAETNSRLNPTYDIPVLQTLFMIKYIPDRCPATLENLATLMIQTIDDDIIQNRKNIDESLRRLVSEKLVAKNGDSYVFLTDEEQDINREIREIAISRNEILSEMSRIIFDILFGVNTKVSYDMLHDFGFNRYIDDMTIGTPRDEIGIKILTPYAGNPPVIDLYAMSNTENNVVYVLPQQNDEYMEEMLEALQIAAFIRKHTNSAKSDAVSDISAQKQREAEQRKKRCRDLTKIALSEADIYINGNVQNIRTKDPAGKAAEAFRILIASRYPRIGFVKKPFLTTDDLRTFLKEKDDQMEMDESGVHPNQTAITDMTDWITGRSGTRFTVKTLLDNYSKSPCGWRELDTIGILLTLLKRQDIRLEKASEDIGVNHPQLIDYVTKSTYNDTVVVRLRKKITPALLGTAKDLARELFDSNTLPADEDGIMRRFVELTKTELYSKTDEYGNNISLSTLLMQYERRNYPGKAILQAGEKLYKEILDIKDNKAFFDNLNDNKEELLDFEEDSHDVRKFFLNQRNVYDKAADTAEIYRKNSAYITDTETVETANEIIRILSLKSPYSEIKDLPELTDRFQTLYVNILEAECSPIEATIKSDRDFVKSYYTEKGITEIASKVQNAFDELLRRLSETQNVFEAIAMNTESDRIKMRLIKEIDEIFAAKQAPEIPENTPENTPKPRLKTISVKTLFTGSNSVKSADDVDRLMKKVGDKLKSQLEENTTLNII